MVFHFGSPPPQDAWNEIPGVREASVEGDIGRFVVDGSVDPLLKAASRFEVLDLVSHEPDLEDIFLTYYGDDVGEHSS
jgi:ABC-2 type transport system ATP-binding protein